LSRKPLISIITVVYNSEAHIGKTIRSVTGQTYERIEYIVVDGQSEDGTLDVVRSHEGVNKLVSEPDDGLYDAMNKGLKLATGDYVWFLNSGDEIFTHETAERMVEGIEPDTDVVYGGTMIIDESGREIGDRRLKPPHNLNWKSFRQGMIVCHQSLIVKRELAQEFNLEYALSADIDWAIRATREAGKIHHAEMILSRFMEGGLSGQNIKQGLRERFKIMVAYYGWLPTVLRHFLFGIRLTNYYLRHRRI
jgi:glycosyltransferase involved in cell wall biosynthesis